MRQKDSQMGFVKETIMLYGNNMDVCGNIYICENGIVVKNAGETIRAPFDYVKLLEKVGDLPLGKVAVEAQIYDQMGTKFDMALNMADSHLEMLQRLCKK